MSDKSQSAGEIFGNGFNCAQSVLSVFAPESGMSERDALRVAGAFGAGMGRMGNVCGAVTGAFMAIGLVSSKTQEGEDHLKEDGYAMVRAFSDRFSEMNGSIECKTLLGVDLSTEEGMAKAQADGLFTTHCAKYVQDSVSILESILRSRS